MPEDVVFKPLGVLNLYGYSRVARLRVRLAPGEESAIKLPVMMILYPLIDLSWSTTYPAPTLRDIPSTR